MQIRRSRSPEGNRLRDVFRIEISFLKARTTSISVQTGPANSDYYGTPPFVTTYESPSQPSLHTDRH